MRYMRFVMVICCFLAVCGCKGKTPESVFDYSRPEDVVAAYYAALFHNDTDTAYGLIWERDRWFVFDDEFRARHKVNTFVYPEYVADKYAYEFLSLQQNEDMAVVKILLTEPDLTLLHDALSKRLFDATLAAMTEAELHDMLNRHEWRLVTREITHRLLPENGHWYMYFDFETQEAVKEFLRQASGLMSSNEIADLVDAREKYNAALALDPASEVAREGVIKAEEKLAARHDVENYINANMELLDFTAGDYSSPEDKMPGPGVYFKILNKGDKTLAKVLVRVVFYDANGREVSSEMLDPLNMYARKDANGLKPGETWQFTKPPYYRTVSAATDWQSKWRAGQGKAFITDVEFADE